MTCKWAKKSLWEGNREACLNPNVHSTRCDPDECPFNKCTQRINDLTGNRCEENDSSGYSGSDRRSACVDPVSSLELARSLDLFGSASLTGDLSTDTCTR